MKRIEALVLAVAVATSAPLSVSGAIICSGESASDSFALGMRFADFLFLCGEFAAIQFRLGGI